ncbi:MAG: hypothetical protein U0Q12_07635 [Vicinamibacterales bacterium]
MNRIAFAMVAVSLGAASLTAQSPSATRPGGPYDRLRFREIGPASAAGRIDDFAVYEKDPSIFYVATATGGLWKTTNHGTTFETVFDRETSSSIGDVAIAPGDPNVVWVGTGENNNRQSSSWGTGVFKSTDGGKTWTHAGLADSRHVARIVVDPVDSNVVYVAALGSLWGAGGDRGVYKTRDAGKTWTRTLFVDDDTGATELVMDPNNNKVLYAATYQRRRNPGGMNGGGPGSGLYKSTDAGETWTPLTSGIPDGPKGRIGLDVYRRDPNIVYARIEHATESGVYRSDDAGASWKKLSSVNPRPMYFSQIRIDPTDDSRIYVLGVQLHVSDDGGKTFRNDGAELIHVDFHAMWINPANSSQLMIGGDGGVGMSYDRSKTYVWLNNMPLGQFYHVTYDMQTPYVICGGLQDNNTWCGPSATRNREGIAHDDWFVISGGDGFQAQMDPSNPRIVYGESQDGRMSRVDRLTNERKSIRPEAPAGERELRWNWDTPMVISPHDPGTLFVAANRLYRSSDRGGSWTAASPDLTTNADREEVAIMGVVGKDIKIAKHDGVSQFPTIVSFAESAKKAGIYWTGSDDGLVQVSKDAGKTWTNVTAKIPGLAKGTYVSEIAPSKFAEGRAYASFDGHRANDFATYLYASDDFGDTWRPITEGLKGQVVRCVAEDLVNQDVLYAGTEEGLFVSIDRGKAWTRVKANLPTVPIYEITIHPRDNDLILATHGRSVWILDDLSPFQQASKAQATTAFLFEAAPAIQRRPSNERMRQFEGNRIFLGKNPDFGASLQFWLKADAKEVKLVVKDAGAKVVRELSGDALKDQNKAGINTAVWDLRVAPVPALRGQAAGGGGFFGNVNEGPMVLPGTYSVGLVVDGRDAGTTSVKVSGDPDISITDADRKTTFDAVMALHELQRTANQAAGAIQDMHDQLTKVQDAIKTLPTVAPEVKTAVDDARKKLDASRQKFGLMGGGGEGGFNQNVRGRVGQLKASISGSTSLPTETQTRVAQELRGELTKAVDEVNGTILSMPALYKLLAEKGVYPVMPKEIKP